MPQVLRRHAEVEGSADRCAGGRRTHISAWEAVLRRFLIPAALLLMAMVVYAVPAVAEDTVTVNFPDGVASGDVTSSRAILWTRADVATNIKVEGWRNSSLSGPKAFIAKI